MDKNWNRGGGNRGGNGGGEKMYKQHYTGGNGYSQNNHYHKKNDFSGQEFYSKTAKPIAQPLKKESLQVALFEDELMDVNFSWIKNT